MDWNVIFELIDPMLLVVVAACWCLGYILKQTPRVADWTIVYFVTGFAILLTVWLLGFSPESVIQGILCGSFAVYGHQVYKQTARRDGGQK
jgi:hypothetical protein